MINECGTCQSLGVENMIRLTLLLSGSIWAAMNFAPELDEPVFTEWVAEVAPVEESAPEVTRTAATRTAPVSPVKMVAPVVVSDLLADPAKVAAIIEPQQPVWFVTASRVNVRQGPSTNYEVMGKVLYGDAALVVSDLDSEWIKIRIEGAGVEGFIMKRFMTDVDPLG